MSSGNADYTNDDFLAEFQQDPSKIFTLDELNGFVLGRPEQFPPGAKKVYTNANTNLLGAVVEKATKRPFADVLEERILEPLGQTNTRYLLDADSWPEPHPVGYAPGESGPQVQPDNLSIFGPAGSMITTIEDGRVWGEILATGALLKPETQAERQQGAPLEAGPPYDLYALGMGQTDGWWGHNGEGLGFTAAVFHQPDTGATVVAFMNESNVVPKAHPADQMFRRVAEILKVSDALGRAIRRQLRERREVGAILGGVGLVLARYGLAGQEKRARNDPAGHSVQLASLLAERLGRPQPGLVGERDEDLPVGVGHDEGELQQHGPQTEAGPDRLVVHRLVAPAPRAPGVV